METKSALNTAQSKTPVQTPTSNMIARNLTPIDQISQNPGQEATKHHSPGKTSSKRADKSNVESGGRKREKTSSRSDQKLDQQQPQDGSSNQNDVSEGKLLDSQMSTEVQQKLLLPV